MDTQTLEHEVHKEDDSINWHGTGRLYRCSFCNEFHFITLIGNAGVRLHCTNCSSIYKAEDIINEAKMEDAKLYHADGGNRETTDS